MVFLDREPAPSGARLSSARVGRGHPAPLQPFEAVIGVEGRLTGDGRLIDAGALDFAVLPMPLRWAPADFGGHDGAVIVGRMDRIERRKDGAIVASGVFDLGSPEGREVVRLIRLGFVSGVSMDLDDVTAGPGEVTVPSEDGSAQAALASVTSEGRIRAATIVAIPAFDDARITLTDEADNAQLDESDALDGCGCSMTVQTTTASSERDLIPLAAI
jgi:hypothetical protein